MCLRALSLCSLTSGDHVVHGYVTIWLVFEGIGYVAKLCRAEPLGMSCHFIRIYTFQRFSKGFPKVFQRFSMTCQSFPKLNTPLNSTLFCAGVTCQSMQLQEGANGVSPTRRLLVPPFPYKTYHNIIDIVCWLVVWNMNFVFPYIGIFIIPTDYFSEG